jgi:hypothetical protein
MKKEEKKEVLDFHEGQKNKNYFKQTKKNN